MKKLFYLIAVFALMLLVVSCDDGEGESGTKEIKIELDKTSIVADGVDAITITVLTVDGDDVTAEAKISVNGKAITGNIFTSTTAGEYYCSATMETESTKRKDFVVNEVPVFKKNIIIEDYTAVWCGYCPRIAKALDNATASYTNVFPVAIHGSNDPYYFTSIGTLASKFGVEGYPTAIIDRDYSWPYPENNGGLKNALNKNAALGLAINATISGSNINAAVKVKFGKDFNESLKLVVCLVENGLIADQTNYYPEYGAETLVDYEHNHVLRKFGTDMFGTSISGSMTKDNIYSKTISFDCSSYEINNCHVVAYVVNSDDIVHNAQAAHAGENVDFEPLSK